MYEGLLWIGRLCLDCRESSARSEPSKDNAEESYSCVSRASIFCAISPTSNVECSILSKLGLQSGVRKSAPSLECSARFEVSILG